MKYLQRIFSIVLIGGMLLGWTSSGTILAKSTEPDRVHVEAIDKFEPFVLEELNTGNADFFVTMKEKADLSYAEQLLTKEEKGQFVFETLVATANRTQADLRAYLNNQGVDYQSFYIANKILVRAGYLDLALAIASREDVAQITANHKFQLDMPKIDPKALNEPMAVEPNITFVKADQVWALGFTGQGMVLAGNDTGLDETHPSIKSHYRGCIDPPACTSYDHNYNWWDATNTYPNDPWDGFGHGTHTTGTMVGDDGAANQIGVAPGAQTVHCKNMTDGGGGDDGTFVECFQWDLAPWDLTGANPNSNLAPDAVNNSWGYWGGGNPTFEDEIAALQAAGILVEVSAGNEGESCGTLRSPGDYLQVLTTGSVNHVTPFPGLLTDFSSRGPSSLYPADYFPDIMAPGENIRSAVPGGGYEGGWSGTSMSGPHATALVGLMWSANPAMQGLVTETLNMIRNTAVPLTGQGGSNCGGDYSTGPNNDWGVGTIDALAAVQEAITFGGAGELDGHVTDATTTDPIQGVKVTAFHEAGYAWDRLTDDTGYYNMVVAEGTFTVTAEIYGYLPGVSENVVVISNTLTTQDFALDLAPFYTVSGHVSDSVSGAPLPGAKIEFLDAPEDPVFADGAGNYSINVAEGTWNMRASADLHQSVDVEVVVTGNVTQNFLLDPLPCILLVDDDQDGPDVREYYTGALDSLGYDYNIWDTGDMGSPSDADLAGYMQVFWFTGYPFSNSFSPANEGTVSTYLDEGGNFFLSSQDYLYEYGLTPFGQNYLHIASFTSDVSQTSVTGQNVFSGLGPYALSYPFTNYSDIVNPNASGQVSFTGNVGNAAVSYNGDDFKSVFLGYPFEALLPAGRVAVMERTVEDMFGGCVPPAALSIDPLTDEQTGDPGTEVTYVFNVNNVGGLPQDVLVSVASGLGWLTTVEPTDLGTIEPGASASATVTVAIPTELGAMSDTFILTATGSEGSVATGTGETTANVNPAVEVVKPTDKNGWPLKVVAYEFTVTNMGDYTDTFALDVSGIWSATLPGGDTTGPLAAGASATVVVVVQVPEGAMPGDTDVTTLNATSVLNPEVSATAQVNTTASLVRMLPIIVK
jgi:hypothetical protein